MAGGTNVTFLNTLNDLLVDVTVELGNTRMTIRELAEMDAGQVIEFAQPSDQPMSLLVNGQLFARGELVRVDENGERLGLRITELIGDSRMAESA